MDKPFFSVIIPTKNRPELLRDVVSSVLLQDFDDYELIVSDNFNDERTADVVSEFKSNKHLNYIRTDKELNMPDHWEFATEKAKGIYVLILTDRSFLKQGALKDIHNSILKSEKKILVCFWNYEHYDEKIKILFGENGEAGTKFLKSKELIKKFSQTLDAQSFLPKPCTGCYRRDFAQKIRQNIGRLYFPVCPDYTSALLFLAYSDFVMYIPRPLFFFQGETVGNGSTTRQNPWPFLNSLNIKNLYQFVPIKAPISSSLIINDFLKIQNLAGGNLKGVDIDWIFYFTTCYMEIIGKMMKLDADMDKEVQRDSLKKWEKTLFSFDKKTQLGVWKEIRREKYKTIIKSYLRARFFGIFLAKTKRFLLRKPTRKYLNALAAGGFSNN